MAGSSNYQDVWITFYAENLSDRKHFLEVITDHGLGVISKNGQEEHPQRYIYRVLIKSFRSLKVIRDKLQSLGIFVLRIENSTGAAWTNQKYAKVDAFWGDLTIKANKKRKRRLNSKAG